MTQEGTGPCDVRDPGPVSALWLLPVAEKVGMGRKMILLLGWLTHGVWLAAALVGEGRAGVGVLLGCLHGLAWRAAARARGGRRHELGRTGWAARPSRPRLLLLPSLLFPFLFLFLFVLCYTSFMYINQSGLFLLWYTIP